MTEKINNSEDIHKLINHKFHDNGAFIKANADPRHSNFYNMFPEICEYFFKKADGPWTRYYELKARHLRRAYRTTDSLDISHFVTQNRTHGIIFSFLMERFWRGMRNKSAHVGVTYDEIFDELGDYEKPTERTIRKILKKGRLLGVWDYSKSSYNESIHKYFPTKKLIKYQIDYLRAEFIFFKNNKISTLVDDLHERIEEKEHSGHSNINLNNDAPPLDQIRGVFNSDLK
tara:strand:- start:288 stop:977 length:690 start_codon:yes stop_codon:yes gene_type:complete